jgi:hypothetical protein
MQLDPGEATGERAESHEESEQLVDRFNSGAAGARHTMFSITS